MCIQRQHVHVRPSHALCVRVLGNRNTSAATANLLDRMCVLDLLIDVCRTWLVNGMRFGVFVNRFLISVDAFESTGSKGIDFEHPSQAPSGGLNEGISTITPCCNASSGALPQNGCGRRKIIVFQGKNLHFSREESSFVHETDLTHAN